MITFSILCIIWGIYSYFKIKQVCKEKNINFSPFETNNIFYFLGFAVGLLIFTASIIIICIKYLP
jgi:hypothetical protein